MPAAITPPATPQSKDLAVPRPTIASNQNKDMANTKRKIICFSDFDGTIFMQDTGHILFDAHGCGPTHRNILDEQIKTGERSFREVSEEMWGSLNVPFDDGFTVMKETLEIDPDFRSFHEYCIANSIPFNVISAGLKPILRRVLDEFLGEEQASHIDIVANEAEISADGGNWKPIWRHDTELGHDKALSITEARQQANLEADDGTIPLIVFIGDGVSDLPAAREADVLFARRGLRLEEYCIENKIAYLGFDTFGDIQREIERIREEDERSTQGKGVPKRFNPRANLWRRVSSQRAVPKLVAATPSREEKMFLWPEAFSEFKPQAGGIAEGVAA
ncbi:2,3-diketo-5-methylthio-1-phosphopentane phosphatase-like protein [Rhexocercosporidium sp. MPI-PUGE-AT-0058]|nr:2,3-diketo-5-methylthio-1-phosphopentane phosphatase-like protein [Rhexocercosporidium sp. MPI-PUGE-AT-0058]